MGEWVGTRVGGCEDRGKSGGKDGGKRLDGIGIRNEGIGGIRERKTELETRRV